MRKTGFLYWGLLLELACSETTAEVRRTNAAGPHAAPSTPTGSAARGPLDAGDARNPQLWPMADVSDAATSAAAPEPQPAGDAATSAEALTFSHIVAAADHYCGLTEPDARIVCVKDGEVLSDDPGPYLTFDMNYELSSWFVHCAIRTSGELECNLDLPFPEGEYSWVSVGLFNVCASTAAGELVCPLPANFGGFEEMPTHRGGEFSVSAWSYCERTGDLTAYCSDRLGDPLLPIEGHYLAVQAAPSIACAAVLATPGEDAGPFGFDGVACFGSGEVDLEVSGLFSSLDVDVNGDGCALGQDGVECWGVFAGSVPDDLDTVLEISVSTQVCVLEAGGTVRCFRPNE
jgi:hypothetical protein